MSDAPLKINGWEIYAHPLFLEQLEALIADVEEGRAKDPEGYAKKRAAKLLAAVLKVAFEVIPQDPARPEYRQGDTLGVAYKHWFRVKFLQQYRLFYRYREAAERRVVVLAWVNDESTLRAYGSRSDAYAAFRKMLRHGNPPNDWEGLVEAASAKPARARLKQSHTAANPKPDG